MTRPAVPPRQRGAALLMALIIVTVVSTLAVSMVWQQWRAVQIETAERSRQQSAWMLGGAMGWTRDILRGDIRADRGNKGKASDNLGEAWAAPLAEARISTFLAADKENTDDAPEAFLSGHIEDAQAKFNLLGLVQAGGIQSSTGGTGGAAAGSGSGGSGNPGTASVGAQPRVAQVEAFKRLCALLNLNPTVPQTIVQGLLEATPPFTTNSASRPLMPQRLDQLQWFGLDANTIKALAPYVILIRDPDDTRKEIPVNVNTASREVIAAALNLNLATAETLVQARKSNAFSADNPHTKYLPATTPAQGAAPLPQVAWQSSYFVVNGRLRLESQVLEQRSLLRRQSGAPPKVEILSSEWVNSSDPG
ncbi:type II secretion system minor pseudopilin GspK [Piscinibacter gummiphilus]|uniref:Type II secretion system protein K n=1 Tax=Piscinibacter gummiphilus TaxID=946333 RepID=A0A1W6L586_9BURK|nr:type II secretion system minor pseudopilin GspK [Piscinibacter gummiphilus]ARN19433.1 hypothetical protein A4W93_05630 [Piscinibacter gummiphilus]ATU64101.1 general secretion pathway protein GspK [Piscinibacter gummiphilus]GLS92930.1 general secretion pathway protein GspK [Piscinibacter gummiphilus]